MKYSENEKLTRKMREAEFQSLNHFLTFADRLNESIQDKQSFPLDEDQRTALRLTYGRLRREMERRANSGRPADLTEAVVDKIAALVEIKGKRLKLKDGSGFATIGGLCEAHNTNYKQWWRRWKEKREKYSLPDKLDQIEVLRRLADGEKAEGARDALNFAQTMEIVRELPALAETRKKSLLAARSNLMKKRRQQSVDTPQV